MVIKAHFFDFLKKFETNFDLRYFRPKIDENYVINLMAINCEEILGNRLTAQRMICELQIKKLRFSF